MHVPIKVFFCAFYKILDQEKLALFFSQQKRLKVAIAGSVA